MQRSRTPWAECKACALNWGPVSCTCTARYALLDSGMGAGSEEPSRSPGRQIKFFSGGPLPNDLRPSRPAFSSPHSDPGRQPRQRGAPLRPRLLRAAPAPEGAPRVAVHGRAAAWCTHTPRLSLFRPAPNCSLATAPNRSPLLPASPQPLPAAPCQPPNRTSLLPASPAPPHLRLLLAPAASRWWRLLPPPGWTPPSRPSCTRTLCGWPSTWATATPAPWSSWWTSTVGGRGLCGRAGGRVGVGGWTLGGGRVWGEGEELEKGVHGGHARWVSVCVGGVGVGGWGWGRGIFRAGL